MSVKCRRYKLLGDFEKVCDFIADQYNAADFNGYLLQPFFEYAHTHPAFNHKLTHRFGIWEDNAVIIAVACYEMNVGECLLSAKKGYEYLFNEMLLYAEKELSVFENDKHILRVMTTDKQNLDNILLRNGYKIAYSEPITIFPYKKGFVKKKLPDGFSIISLEDENDFEKINACLFKGFDHGPNPDNDFDCRMLMQSAPRFRKDLTTIIKAPNGEYACFAGMWVERQNKYAYLEPLATVPEYRRIGLATIALTEAMRKTIKDGAVYCFGGVREFYYIYGFDTVGYRNMWEKLW